MIHPTPTKTLLTTTFESLVMKLSGLLARGTRLIDTQRLKRSGMSWTIAGGQVMLDLRVIRLSHVWHEVHQRYLASKPIPITRVDTAKVAPHEQLVA